MMQYAQNPKASLYFCDRRFMRGALLVGTMEVLWDEAGKDGQDYCACALPQRKGSIAAPSKQKSLRHKEQPPPPLG